MVFFQLFLHIFYISIKLLNSIRLKSISREKLNDSEREKILKPLMESGWIIVKDRDALYKEYKFENFIQVATFCFFKSYTFYFYEICFKAFGFMTSLAIFAEKHDHHPEWFNVYNKVI